MKKKNTKKLNPHNTPRKDRSAAAWLLAIFCLLLVWFLLWLYDWYDELFGLKKKASKNTAASTAINNGGENSSSVINYSTIEYQPIQHIIEQNPYSIVFKFPGATTAWNINQLFEFVPIVKIYDLNGAEIFGDITMPIIEEWDENTQNLLRRVENITVSFEEPQSGFVVVR